MTSPAHIERLSDTDKELHARIMGWRDSIRDRLPVPALTDEWRKATEKDQEIFSSTSGAIDLVQEKLKGVEFSLLALSAKAKQHTIDFYIGYFQRSGIDIEGLLSTVEESAYFHPDHVVRWNDRRVSSDLLRRHAMHDVICRHASLPDRPMTVLEVGGGYGGFARLFSRLHPRTTYVIVDLPDSLCYSAAFLGLNFPDSRHCLVTPEIADGMTPETLRQYDFVFVPVGLERPFMGFDIDLLVNTYSFGEIPNAVVERWFQAINSARNIRNLFLLNHFLNKLAYTYKPDGNAASLLLGPDWEIAAWELNPEYTEDPIETQLDLNYLQLVATRRDPRPLAERKREALDLVRFARGLPWYRTITIDLKREPGTPRALRRMPASRAGGLLRLQWDAARLMPCLETVETLALYLMSLTTDGHPFGETVYLKNRLKTLPTADEIAD